ncbi:MAG: hypothetical protein ACTHM8_04475 [Sphingomonas sp.]
MDRRPRAEREPELPNDFRRDLLLGNAELPLNAVDLGSERPLADALVRDPVDDQRIVGCKRTAFDELEEIGDGLARFGTPGAGICERPAAALLGFVVPFDKAAE